jgi:ABC-type transport system involved in multi-copper enzyme maturation permease subunit
MTVLPVIEREMRTQARLGFTYVLRVIGATALLLLCAYVFSQIGFSQQIGGMLFGILNAALLISIWVLVPLSCADCISRERREGTLGLLFLTPLKAREIVLSKGIVHGLRAMTLWLSAAPILTICFLIGGVTWREAVLSGLINFSSICWALAAGLLASSSTKSWLRAMLLAGGLAACFVFGFIFLNGLMVLLTLRHQSGFYLPFPFTTVRPRIASGILFHQVPWYQEILGAGFFATVNIDGWWGNLFGSLTKAGQRAWLLAGCETALLSILFLLGVILFAAWMVRRAWQEEPPSARRVWVEQALTQPIIGVNFFHRWLRRKLERNPIGWLEQRTWSGRLVTWGWFAVMVSFYSAVFYVPHADLLLRGLQSFMAWSLLLIICVSSAGSFQRERETRVLELLLVSPMTAGQIIWGRLRGLWGQFLPALLLMVVVWTYLASIFQRETQLMPFFCSGYLALPVIGLYYSLRRANFISAFLSTVAVGLFLPQVTITILDISFRLIFLGMGLEDLTRGLGGNVQSIWSWFSYALFEFLGSPHFPAFLQAFIAVRLARKLYDDLVHRNFLFSKGAA